MCENKIIPKRIEQLSLHCLQSGLIKSERISYEIQSNDKTPSWDGYIYLHKDRELTKENIIKIPIQLKGLYVVGMFDDKMMKHKVDKKDLINYKADNGVLFLVVQIKNENEYRVFYNDLLPADINDILEHMGKNDTKRIVFNRYDMSTTQSVESVLINFHEDRIKQKPNSAFSKDPSKYDRLIFEHSGYKLDFGEILSLSKSIYGVIDNLPGEYFPVGRGQINEVNNYIECEISANNEKFYDGFTHIQTKESTFFKVGPVMTVEGNSQIKFEFHDNFYERYHESKFLKAFFEGGGFEANGVKVFRIKEHKMPDTIRSIIKNLEAVNELYKVLKINANLNFKNITHKEAKELYYLLEHLNARPYKGKVSNINDFHKIKISNITLMFYVIKDDDGNMSLADVMDPEFHIECWRNEEKEFSQHIPYILSLKRKDFITISNVSFDIILKTIYGLEHPHSPLIMDVINTLLLEMIHAYDSTKSEDLLKCAYQINEFIIENDSNPINSLINKYQIISRERGFSNIELTEIAKLKKEQVKLDDADEILFGLHIVSGDKVSARLYYEDLSQESKDNLKDYPIMTLYSGL